MISPNIAVFFGGPRAHLHQRPGAAGLAQVAPELGSEGVELRRPLEAFGLLFPGAAAVDVDVVADVFDVFFWDLRI